jgi:DNA-binding transcriptional regulator YiaG
MSGGGSSPSHTTQTVINDVPDYAKPYFERNLERAEAVTNQPYAPYQHQRLADFSADSLASHDRVRQIADTGSPHLAQAQQYMGLLGLQANNLGNRAPAQFSAFEGARETPISAFGGISSAANLARAYGGFRATAVSPYSGFRSVADQAREFDGFRANVGTAYDGFESAAGQANAFQFDPARQFTNEEAARYMSPYMDEVVQRQQDDMRRQFDEMRSTRDARAIGSGAFGGSRQAVQEGLAEDAAARQMGDISAMGRQRAFETATQLFNSDRAAQMQRDSMQAQEDARVQGIGISEAGRVQSSRADDLARFHAMNTQEFARVQDAMAREAARVQGITIDEARRIQQMEAQELARVQGISVQEAARVQAANAAEQARVQGIAVSEAGRVQGMQLQDWARVQQMQAQEAARVQGLQAQDWARVQQSQADEYMRRDQFGLSTLGFQGDMATQWAALGEQARAGDIQAAQMLERIGMQQMSQQQAGLDIGYQDFLRQQQYPMQQTAFMADLLRGLPIAGTGTQTTQQPYNPLQEMLGLGISGVGLYNALNT